MAFRLVALTSALCRRSTSPPLLSLFRLERTDYFWEVEKAGRMTDMGRIDAQVVVLRQIHF